MKYASVCSGVEAASLAWECLGWKPVWFSEIEPFPCEVLKQRFPNVPNLGDMTKIKVENLENGDQRYTNAVGADVIVPGGVDLLVGGTPCQSFSVAGKREGLEGASGLARTFVELLGAMQPRWFVWENVPGCLSSKSNAGIYDFNFLLAAFAERGYSCGWRIFNSQYVRVDGFPRAVPQRRRRVFVVGHLGKQWEYPAKVLFEQQSLLGNTPPCRIKGKGFTADVERSIGAASTDVSGLDCYNQCLSGDVSMTVTSKRSDPHHVPCAVQSVKSTFWNGRDIAATLTTAYADELGFDNQHVDQGCPNFVITSNGADVCDTLDASYYKGVGNRNGNERTIICLNDQGCSVMQVENDGNAGTLRANTHGNEQIVCCENHANDSRVKEMGDSCQTLNSRMGTGGGNLPLVQERIGYYPSQHQCPKQSDTPTLTTDNCSSVRGDTPLVQEYYKWHSPALTASKIEDNCAPPILAAMGMGGTSMTTPMFVIDQGQGNLLALFQWTFRQPLRQLTAESQRYKLSTERKRR